MSSWWSPIEEDEIDGWDLHAVVRSCRPTNSVIFQSADALIPSHNTDLTNTSSSVQELEETKFNLPPATIAQLPRLKRRKNQQKRRVCQVLADGLSGDLWSWRKYGQKPIKGSPFPRGYYRCSSSKGCLARKQVERSRTDQGMFVITYTGEHNHPIPTHRNSLAGSTRQKIPWEPSTSAGEGGVRLSPNTPLTAGMEEELLRPRKKKKKKEKDEDLDMLLVEDMEVVGDDEVLFTGFEELQSFSSPAVDGIFDWDGESRRTGTPLWRPAGDG